MRRINEIYQLFNDFNSKNPGYFEDLQIGQLEILGNVIDDNSIAKDIKLQILFETCKQLLSFVDEKIYQKNLLFRSSQSEEAEKSRFQSRTSQFFSTQFAAVKETLNIGQLDNILVDKVMGALFYDAHDEYFKIKVHRILEAHKRLDPSQQEISTESINKLVNLLREPLDATEAYEQIKTEVKNAPQLKSLIDAEYELNQQYWIPQHIAGKEYKRKKPSKRMAFIEGPTNAGTNVLELKKLQHAMINLGLDYRTIDTAIATGKEKAQDQLLLDVKAMFEKSTKLDEEKMKLIESYINYYKEEEQNQKPDKSNDEPTMPSTPEKQ